jgi:DNA recombination protein RmuC
VLEKDRTKTIQSLDGEIKKVVESNLRLAKETTALKDALKRPHVRGRWGEMQLRNCIDLAGMSEFADVSFQDTTSDDEGARHIPDMIVRMPGGRRVIVDAKTPIDAFLAALDAPTEEARRLEMARHGRHLKEHVKRLSTRAYAEVIKESADFTVLFLPNESFLYAALEAEPDVVEFALQKKVLIATPPTLIGLLKVIRYGWSEERLAENAQKISELGQELHKRLCDFVDTYVTVGKHIDKAKEEFEKGRARLESRVLVQARRFEALGAKSNKSLIEAPVDAQDI